VADSGYFKILNKYELPKNEIFKQWMPPKTGHLVKIELAMYKLRKFIYMIFPPCVFIGLLIFLPWAIFVAPPDIWRVLPHADGQITDAMRFRAKVGGCIVGTLILIVSGLATLRIVKRIIRKRYQK
jgi:hypothetical protein